MDRKDFIFLCATTYGQIAGARPALPREAALNDAVTMALGLLEKGGAAWDQRCGAPEQQEQTRAAGG